MDCRSTEKFITIINGYREPPSEENEILQINCFAKSVLLVGRIYLPLLFATLSESDRFRFPAISGYDRFINGFCIALFEKRAKQSLGFIIRLGEDPE
ncbi:hypothetical protein CEXT_727691 [Caerostris extrusa]|uniref:Uncharacterized protein n=1 Tax=Caerostris extrusa TaxID=172846 RepID=A0AAV4NRL9_CAEEX|nr:hypothetical protein CEXT_727691 [Caerostris extrusa]